MALAKVATKKTPKKSATKTPAKVIKISHKSSKAKTFVFKTTAKVITVEAYLPLKPPSPLPPLLSLPNELRTQVFKDLAPENLISLALTCKYAGYMVTATRPNIPRTTVVTRKLCSLLSPDLLPPDQHMCGECGLAKQVEPNVKATWYMSDEKRKSTVLTADKHGRVNAGWHVQVAPRVNPAKSSASKPNPITNAICPFCARSVYNRSADGKRAKEDRFESVVQWKHGKKVKEKEKQFNYWIVRKETSFCSRFAGVNRLT